MPHPRRPRPPLHALAALAAACLLLPAPRPARACGPGVHMREASRLLELLAERSPAWAERAEAPLARSYLWLGSISPDFEWPVAALTFGHSTGLGLHLLDAAEDAGPQHALFALGHVAHMASDPACEMFHTPTLFASAPLGPFDLFVAEDGEDAEAESEALVEGLGDLVLGDWGAVVDVLYDFWLEDEAARQRAREIMAWYCETGAGFHGAGTDCPAVVAELEGLLGRAEELLGGMDRETAGRFVAGLVDQDPVGLVGFYTTGLPELLGSGAEGRTAWFDAELARLKESALVDPALWTRYDDLADLGPRFALDRVLLRPAPAWPDWEPRAIICGNVQSVLRFLPEADGVVPGLIADGLGWEDEAGDPVDAVTPALAHAPLVARVRLYSALPFDGEVRGVVRKDRPGLDTSGDEVLGEATLALEVDPLAYVTTLRSELEIPFAADPEGAVGYYVELYADGSDLPWLTTSWDAIWASDALDLGRPALRDHFGTYGHWPPSLPVTEPPDGAATLLVSVRVAPAGPGLPDARVELAPGVDTTTGAHGVARFEGLEPGRALVSASASGHAPAADVPVTLGPRSATWLEVPLHAVPAVAAAGPWVGDRSCVPFTWDPEPFAGQAAAFHAWLVEADDGTALGEPADVGLGGEGEACSTAPLPDGSRVRVRLQAEHGSGARGVEGTSEPVTLDGSPPELSVEVEASPPDDCDAAASAPLLVTVEAHDPHSPVAGVLDWRLGEEPWQAAERDEGAAAWELRVDPGDGTDAAGLHVRVDNAAGLVAERGPVVLPGRADPCGDDAGPLPVAAGADGGCGCGLAGARRQARWAVPGVLLRRR